MSPAAVPSLPSRPLITPELVGQSVHLRCTFVPPPWSQPLGFQVVWARHIGHSMKAEIRQESTLKAFSLVEMDGVHFRLGETVIPARPSPGAPRGGGWGGFGGFNPSGGKPWITLNSPCPGSDLCSEGREANVGPVPPRDGERRKEKINQLQTGGASLHMLHI